MQVGVSPNNTNVPVILKQQMNSLHIDFVYYIVNFLPTTPPSSAFNVPPSCGPTVEQQFMKNADQPSLIMPPFMMDPTGEVFKKMAEFGNH